MQKKTAVVGLAFAVAVIAGLVLSSPDARDNFCLCSQRGVGGRTRVCNGGTTQQEYDDGNTEYQDFGRFGPRAWSTVSPGDIDYPVTVGKCESRRCTV